MGEVGALTGEGCFRDDHLRSESAKTWPLSGLLRCGREGPETEELRSRMEMSDRSPNGQERKGK